jgi:predicted nucleic acid-binding protein
LTLIYADPSALVKLYVAEAGTAEMRRQATAAEIVASSVLAWPELLGLLARRRREGLLTDPEHAQLRARFVEDYADLLVVDLDGRALELVDRLVADHALGSAAAVHLASALVLAEAGLAPRFACCDRPLLAAARGERLDAFDPADSPR